MMTSAKAASFPKVVFVAGGGTGGHLFPGLAIARALKVQDPSLQIFFVGTAEGLEARIIPKTEFKLFLIPGGKLNFQGKLIAKIKTLLQMPWAFFLSARLILRYSPQMVLGVGGYASGPFVLVASLMGFPTAIWEPNAYPGMANRWLSKWVDHCLVVFEETKKYFPLDKVIRLGMPIRQELEASMPGFLPGKAMDSGPRADKVLKILCFGGSQGSRVINNSLFEVLKVWDSEGEGRFEVVHQIGSTDWKQFKDKYKDFKNKVTPLEFIFDMATEYQRADIVLARSGASTLAELSGFSKAALIIPLPGADAHQEKNALTLSNKNAAEVILQKDLTSDLLRAKLESLRPIKRRQELSKNIQEFFEPRAAEQIARHLLGSLL